MPLMSISGSTARRQVLELDTHLGSQMYLWLLTAHIHILENQRSDDYSLTVLHAFPTVSMMLVFFGNLNNIRNIRDILLRVSELLQYGSLSEQTRMSFLPSLLLNPFKSQNNVTT
ncbi:hypothetical protein RRG08_044902 [Elysia crispata]|uniref:Uncharacterized protein n=1 Tax=Elysia crispata TaxID=231223 RepID=A0AAE0ZE60_9GAST|nr:hypothetical protein RRG08_044902 [Elysia crispata]